MVVVPDSTYIYTGRTHMHAYELPYTRASNGGNGGGGGNNDNVDDDDANETAVADVFFSTKYNVFGSSLVKPLPQFIIFDLTVLSVIHTIRSGRRFFSSNFNRFSKATDICYDNNRWLLILASDVN